MALSKTTQYRLAPNIERDRELPAYLKIKTIRALMSLTINAFCSFLVGLATNSSGKM